MTFIIFSISLFLAVSVKGSTFYKIADFGYNFTLPCAGNTTKDVIWIKRNQLPGRSHLNFNVLQNGALHIVNAQNNHSGEYLCETVNTTEIIKVSIESVSVDQNYTIQCSSGSSNETKWFKHAKVSTEDARVHIWRNGSLYVNKVTREDVGEYLCTRANVVESAILERSHVSIRTPPLPLNVTIKPSTIIALVLWNVTGNGGYPIINFTAEYRLAHQNSSWIPISPNHITPNCRQLEVYSLKPNTTYEFRIWATNQLGRSPVVNVFGTTQASYKEEDLLRHLFREVEEFNASDFTINVESWTGIWSVAVGIFTITFLLLCFGTVILLSKEWHNSTDDDPKPAEHVPNVIMNPNFENEKQQSIYSARKEDVNDKELSRLNSSWATENTAQK